MTSAPTMARAAHRTVLAVLLASLSLAAPGTAASLDQLMRDFRVTPEGSKPAPTFTLATLGGKPAALSAQRGRLVLLYFWATW